jgi:hypothetical protein
MQLHLTKDTLLYEQYSLKRAILSSFSIHWFQCQFLLLGIQSKDMDKFGIIKILCKLHTKIILSHCGGGGGLCWLSRNNFSWSQLLYCIIQNNFWWNNLQSRHLQSIKIIIVFYTFMNQTSDVKTTTGTCEATVFKRHGQVHLQQKW